MHLELETVLAERRIGADIDRRRPRFGRPRKPGPAYTPRPGNKRVHGLQVRRGKPQRTASPSPVRHHPPDPVGLRSASRARRPRRRAESGRGRGCWRWSPSPSAVGSTTSRATPAWRQNSRSNGYLRRGRGQTENSALPPRLSLAGNSRPRDRRTPAATSRSNARVRRIERSPRPPQVVQQFRLPLDPRQRRRRRFRPQHHHGVRIEREHRRRAADLRRPSASGVRSAAHARDERRQSSRSRPPHR